ncbi:MAG: phosphate acyltransferase PlsX [Verrucomicrobia bacterium]|nr:phosphate acyltransferase PlsX [Verrucomicrobiota bacterium]MBU6446879.1 phosphate acyltransferase PlsX [Verrucomicrobiota bacterium]MDE3046960.1 phosphate acyltransferase PlsX [Verrucomicrobiota bacterium]
MSRALKIGVDLMGNDNAPQTLLEALKGIHLPSQVTLVLIGTPELASQAHPFAFVSVREVIEMDEHPLKALRKKKQASIPTGMRLLKEGQIDAFVSAGNTGALVSAAKMIVRSLPGILRPCLLTLMPTKKNPVAVLDVGAGVEAKANHLVQFASIGSAFQKTRGIAHPTVGLLNIGSEPLKGTSELRLAYHALQKKQGIHFAGNIEGKTVFDGDVDVLITDGFTGNVFLKTAEGIASLILDKIHADLAQVQKFQSLHYAEYPGAILAGIRGIVIKCHGYSTPKGFTNAVLGAIELAKEEFVQKLMNELL